MGFAEDEERRERAADAAMKIRDGGCPECETKAYDTIFREGDLAVDPTQKKTDTVMSTLNKAGWKHMKHAAGMLKLCEKCQKPTDKLE